MGIGVFVEKVFLTGSNMLSLILLVATGVIIYGSMVLLFNPNIYNQIKELRGA